MSTLRLSKRRSQGTWSNGRQRAASPPPLSLRTGPQEPTQSLLYLSQHQKSPSRKLVPLTFSKNPWDRSVKKQVLCRPIWGDGPSTWKMDSPMTKKMHGNMVITTTGSNKTPGILDQRLARIWSFVGDWPGRKIYNWFPWVPQHEE